MKRTNSQRRMSTLQRRWIFTSVSSRYRHFKEGHRPAPSAWPLSRSLSLPQRALATLLSGEEEDFNSKEAQVLLSLLSVLSRQLQPSSAQVDHQCSPRSQGLPLDVICHNERSCVTL